MRIEEASGGAEIGASALLLLQAAAFQARIGPFAFRLATPQSAASCYRAVARLAARPVVWR